MANNWLRDRTGWGPYLEPFLFKKLPPGTGWSATLGSLCALLFGLMALTGIFLAMYYNPSPDKAYQSVDFIMKDVPMGSILRGLHHWGASAMVIIVAAHLLSSFFSGSYKAPRELTWIAGVCLLLITLGLGFTGYLLPWDMKAYWATTVSANIPRDIPGLGGYITRVMLGGEVMSGLTLTRFYAIHTLLLPALLAMTAMVHIYLVRIHGIAEVQEKKCSEAEADSVLYRFFPEHAFRSSIAFCVLLLLLMGLSVLANVPKEEMAGTIIESYLPRPEWYYMWLFQLLTYFSGSWEVVGSLAIPILGTGILFAVPFLGRTRVLGVSNRPLPLAVGVTSILCITYLTIMGFAGARPYGQSIPVPDRTLSASEARGLYVYVDRECAYCHQIQGRGGHRTGPDLSNTVSKKRSMEYLNAYLKNPQAVSATSIMPKYDMPESDVSALSEFILSLDFNKHAMKILEREEIIKPPAMGQSQKKPGS